MVTKRRQDHPFPNDNPSKRARTVAVVNAMKFRGKNAATLPPLSEIVEKITNKFGGPEGIAEEFFKVYTDPQTSTLTKGRLIEYVMGLLNTVGKGGGGQMPLDQLSTEEIEAAAGAALDAANGQALDKDESDEQPAEQPTPAIPDEQ